MKPTGSVLNSLAASLMIAAASWVIGWFSFHGHAGGFELAILINLGLTLVWAVMVCVSIVRYRWRGLSLFIGAPLALYYQYVFAVISWSCSHGHGCL